MTRYAGQTLRIYFDTQQDGNGDKTYMYLDDVSLKVQSGTSGQAVVNGGFESGLTNWQSRGVQPAQASTVRAHGGSHSALLGWTASPEAEGDSGILQQVSIPATATRAILS